MMCAFRGIFGDPAKLVYRTSGTLPLVAISIQILFFQAKPNQQLMVEVVVAGYTRASYLSPRLSNLIPAW